MNTALTRLLADDPHEKTIDLRLHRLAELTALADTIVRHDSPASDDYIARALSGLVENRTLLRAHADALLNRIVATFPLDQQDELIASEVRPITIAVDAAAIAIARLRHLTGRA